MELSLFVDGVFLIILLRVLVKRLFYPRPLPGIPYNKDAAKKFTGDLQGIEATYEQLTEWMLPIGRRSLQYGSPIHQIFMNPFVKPFVVIDDPREVSDIPLRRSKEFDRSAADGVFSNIAPHATVAQQMTPEFKAQRRMWQDTMHPNFLWRVVAKNIYAAAKDLTRLWEARLPRSDGSPIDVGEDFSLASLDAIWAATSGERLGLVDTHILMLESGKKVETPGVATHGVAEYIGHLGSAWRGSIWPALTRWRMKTSKYRSYMEAKDRELDKILLNASARFQTVLESSDDGEEHDTCAMDLVLRRNMLIARQAGKPIPDPTTDAAMRDELLVFIYGGHDTTSITLQWFVKFITNNQEAQNRLRVSLRSAFPGNALPDVEDVVTKDVPYLNATIEETLRRASTAGHILRLATKDTEVLGYKIPTGTVILFLTSLNWHPVPVPEEQRSPTSRAAFEKSGSIDWTRKPNAQVLEKFVPERWLKVDNNGDEVFDPNALFQNAFGGGTRGCFGRRLAMMELRIMITLMVMSFKFLPVPTELNSFQVFEQRLRPPRQCFVKLEAT